MLHNDFSKCFIGLKSSQASITHKYPVLGVNQSIQKFHAGVVLVILHY